MPYMDFPSFAIVMMVYSFLGWLYESTIYSLCEQGRFMNRGCFIGPYCPIYSVVVMVSVYSLHSIQNPFLLLLIGGGVCSVIEFVTATILDKTVHERYWDYSAYPLNFQGKISVPSSLFFGVTVLFAVRVLHPATMFCIERLPDSVRLCLCILFCVMFFTDALLTLNRAAQLNERGTRIYEKMDNAVEGKIDILNEKKEYLNRFAIVSVGKGAVGSLKGIGRRCVDVENRVKNGIISERERHDEE